MLQLISLTGLMNSAEPPSILPQARGEELLAASQVWQTADKRLHKDFRKQVRLAMAQGRVRTAGDVHSDNPDRDAPAAAAAQAAAAVAAAAAAPAAAAAAAADTAVAAVAPAAADTAVAPVAPAAAVKAVDSAGNIKEASAKSAAATKQKTKRTRQQTSDLASKPADTLMVNSDIKPAAATAPASCAPRELVSPVISASSLTLKICMCGMHT